MESREVLEARASAVSKEAPGGCLSRKGFLYQLGLVGGGQEARLAVRSRGKGQDLEFLEKPCWLLWG